MDAYYDCPDCGRIHDEPAEPAYVLSVRCLDCELEALYRAEMTTGYELMDRAA